MLAYPTRPMLRQDIQTLAEADPTWSAKIGMYYKLRTAKTCVVELSPGTLVGYAIAAMDGDYIDILRVFAFHGFRRLGAGSVLVESLIESSDIDATFECYIPTANKPAVDFFGSLGFYPSNHVADEVLMRRGNRFTVPPEMESRINFRAAMALN